MNSQIIFKATFCVFKKVRANLQKKNLIISGSFGREKKIQSKILISLYQTNLALH